MNRHPWTAGRVFLLAGGCAALLAVFTATAAHSQGISAQAKVVKPDPPPDINALRQQLLALQQRVEKLEKEKQVEQAKPPDDAGDEARAKKVEQRLANLEKHQESAKPESARKQDHHDDEAPLTVRAPFVVVDGAGKPLMRVVEDGDVFSRGMYIFDSSAQSVAHIGVNAVGGGGRIYVGGRGGVNGIATAMMASTPNGPILALRANNKVLTQMDKQSLAYYSDAGTPIAVFGGSSKDRSRGYLELNEAGSKMVEAGVLDSHKGYVLTSPYRASVEPHGDPSVLKGAGK